MDRFNLDRDRVIQMHKSGLTYKEIGDRLNVSASLISKRFKEWGCQPGLTSTEVDVDKVVRLYTSGMSENAVAKEMGVSRNVIRHRLKNRGVHIRSQSEAESLKWSQMSDEERANQVAAANEKTRNMPKEFFIKNAIKQAKTKEKTLSKVGDLEMIFKERFEEKGFKVIPQKAVYVYNIDLAIRNTAIEIHVTSSFPHNTATYRKRIVELLKRDWNVIYIRVRSKLSIQRATDKVSAMIDLIESNKPPVCQYGMVRGTGKLETTGSLNGDNLTVVDASDGFFSSLK